MIQSLCLLGSFRVAADPFINPPRKSKALLALLAMAALDGEGMSRERLSTMLWPYQGSEQARHSLRNCLLELRKALHPEAIKILITDFANCRLDMSTDIADFARLEKSQRQQDLALAAELYRGELLDDLWITSEPFREWLELERDLWRQRAVVVLIRLSEIATGNADHDASIRAARRGVHIEPWNEAGHRQLMIALEAGGLHGEAMRQFRTCRKMLKDELGIDPDPETSDLAARLFPEPQDEVLLRRAMQMFDKIITTRQVGTKSVVEMRDSIKQRLGADDRATELQA